MSIENASQIRVAILITCFNRREKTVACLDALKKNMLPEHTSLTIFLVDDNSTDGTSEIVSIHFPDVRIIRGSGSLYWGGGMRLALAVAQKQNFDFYFWLNDDTFLFPDAILRMFEVYREKEHLASNGIVVAGTTCDAASDKPTYGGQIRQNPTRKLGFHLVFPSDTALPCETINGNCVLLSDIVVRKVGNIDAALIHSMGDIDYGLRAGMAGCSLWVMPGFVGTCSYNPSIGTYKDRDLPLRARIKKMLEPKGLPLNSWKVLTKRHTGLFWIAYWLWPYSRLVLDSLVKKLPRKK